LLLLPLLTHQQLELALLCKGSQLALDSFTFLFLHFVCIKFACTFTINAGSDEDIVSKTLRLSGNPVFDSQLCSLSLLLRARQTTTAAAAAATALNQSGKNGQFRTAQNIPLLSREKRKRRTRAE
jgi:hypothetical protein